MSSLTGFVVALDVIVLVVLVDLAVNQWFVPVSAMVIAPLAACAFSGPRATLVITAFALAAGLVIGARDGMWASGDLVGRASLIVVGGCVGAVLATIRERREASLAQVGRHLRVEHELVSILQESLLPAAASTTLPGVRLATLYLPVNGRADVGGDWFDAFVIDDQRLAISIGDVAGHSLESAALMVQLRIGIRLAALQGMEPGVVLDEASRLMQSIARHDFATAIFGIYDVASHRLAWSRAGHCLPVIAEAGSARLLDHPGGPPLGVFSPRPYPTVITEVAEDGVVLLHTDGLYERRNQPITVGEAVLLDLVAAALDAKDDLQQFVNWLPVLLYDGDAEDDICILALQRGGQPHP